MSAPDLLQNPTVTLVRDEYEFMSDLVCSSERTTFGIELLWREIERAVRVDAGKAPRDVVRLHSLVTFTRLDTGEQRSVRLTPAGEDCPAEGGVSIVSELGAALIGLRPGDRFHWWSEAGTPRSVRIERVEQDRKEEARRRGREARARRKTLARLLSLGDD
jgi:regulator of nucleoside diphosphate kinase